MIFFDAILAILNFDLYWFFDLVSGGIMWVFLFFAASYIFAENNLKSGLKLYTVLLFELFLVLTLFDFTGWGFSGNMLLLYYMSKLAMVGFMEDVEALKPFLVIATVMHGLVVLLFYNWFLI